MIIVVDKAAKKLLIACSVSGFLFRDSRLLSIGGGADEVMLAIICKYMDTLPRK